MKKIIEPDYRYCPQCMDEYRSGIAMCASCRTELIDGAQMLRLEEERKKGRNPVSRISADEELVAVRKGTVREIKNLQTLLAESGIPSLVAADSQSCGKGCCGSEVLLHVRPEDADETMGVLKRDYIRSTGLQDYDMRHATAVFNSNAEQAVCPACGYNFSTTSSTCPECGLCFS